ncbi:zinc ribbon domain-containing protein [Chloroflexota bacterium]
MVFLVLLLLGLAAAAVILYPLMPGQSAAAEPPPVSGEQIDRAVRDMRRPRGGGLLCPQCGKGYRAGDRFCVHCGDDLASEPAPAKATCPSCGSTIRDGDRFCAKCGQDLPATEASP